MVLQRRLSDIAEIEIGGVKDGKFNLLPEERESVFIICDEILKLVEGVDLDSVIDFKGLHDELEGLCTEIDGLDFQGISRSATRSLNGYRRIVRSRLLEEMRYQIVPSVDQDEARKSAVDHLFLENPNEPDAVTECQWTDVATDSAGVIPLSLYRHLKKPRYENLSTGDKTGGPVAAMRYFDPELGFWVYETKREIGGEELINEFRVVPHKKEARNTFQFFNRYREKVQQQMMSGEYDSDDLFDEFVWVTETNSSGRVAFHLVDVNGKARIANLSTGKREGPGEVVVRRFYDNELSEWVFETTRIIDGEEIRSESRLEFKEEWGIPTLAKFSRFREKIVRHCLSDNPSDRDGFEEFVWHTKTDKKGRLNFYIPQAGAKFKVSTGSEVEGAAVLRRFYGEMLEDWVYEVRREVNGQTILKYYVLERGKDDEFNKFKYVGRSEMDALMVEDTDSPEPAVEFNNLSWVTNVGDDGMVDFDFFTLDGSYCTVNFFTGVAAAGEVEICRVFDESSKRWIVTCNRFVDGVEYSEQTILMKNQVATKSGRGETMDLLYDPNHKVRGKHRELVWDVISTGEGNVVFGLRDGSGKRFTVGLYTYKSETGLIQVRRFYDEMLKMWIFETRRFVEGKEVTNTLRLEWDEDMEFCRFRGINKYNWLIGMQLLSDDPQSRELFEDLDFEAEVGDSGRYLINHERQEMGLPTGKQVSGKVRIKRFFDEEINEWLYSTDRVVDGERIYCKYRLVRSEATNCYRFELFDPVKETIRKHLSLVVAGKEDLESFSKVVQLSDRGRYHVYYNDENGIGRCVTISTGFEKGGEAELSLLYDEESGIWLYCTRRTDDEWRYCTKRADVVKVRYYRVLHNGKYNTLKQYKLDSYYTPEVVKSELTKRVEAGLLNTPDALSFGRNPDKPLLEAARRFGIELPAISVLDHEFVREAEVAAITPSGVGENIWELSSQDEVARYISMLSDGKAVENGDNVKLNDSQSKLLKILLSAILRFPENLPTPLKELLFMSCPQRVDVDDLHRLKLEFEDEQIEGDVFQETAVKMAMHPRNSLVMIQGGPGSGKTQTLVEISRQFVNQGQRVLVVSRSNKAVDNLMLRLDRSRVPVKRAVSCYNLEAVDESLRKHQIFSTDSYEEAGHEAFELRHVNGKGYVVGVTTGSMDRLPITKGFETYDVVVIDEAGTLSDVETILAAAKAAKKVIIAGDHKQLEPFYKQEDMEGCKLSYQEAMKESGMARRWCKGLNQIFLARNYRSHPILAMMIGRMIYDRLVTPRPWSAMEEDTLRLIDVPAKDGEGNEEDIGEGDYINVPEAKKAIEEVERALKSGYRPEQVSIIAGYREQVNLIRDHLKLYLVEEFGFDKDLAEEIAISQVDTVDKFQGDENEVIIFSFVRSNPVPSRIGHMKNLNRLNVALSRAKDRLIILGDEKTLKNVDNGVADNLGFVGVYANLERIRADIGSLWLDQLNYGGFTLREAIQKMNGLLDRDVDLGILDHSVIKNIEAYLTDRSCSKFDQQMKGEELKLMSELHQLSLCGQDKIFLSEDDLEEMHYRIMGFAFDLSNFLAYDDENFTIRLKWFNEDKVIRLIQKG